MKEPMYIRKAETESIRGDRIILYYFTVETRGKDADERPSYSIGVDMYTQLPGERTIRERKISDSVFSSKEEAEKLVDELMTLKNPFSCPHGRPTIIRMSKYELEKKFSRII